MKCNKLAQKISSIIGGGVLMYSFTILLSGCQCTTERNDGSISNSNDPKLIRVPQELVPVIISISDSLEGLDANIIGSSLSGHTVRSFQNFMQDLGVDTPLLTQRIDKISSEQGDISLLQKGLSWQIGLYPMLSIDTLTNKKRIKVYVIPTLAHFVDVATVDNIQNYRISSVRSSIYKDIDVPVYDLGNDLP
jgi:hypothetical protein